MRNANEPVSHSAAFKITTCGLKECIQEVSSGLTGRARKRDRRLKAEASAWLLSSRGRGARVYKSDGADHREGG